MNAIALKSRIKKKFGSITKFAILAKMSRYEVQLMLASPRRYSVELRALSALANRTKPAKDDPILHENLNIIREAIVKAGGVKAWCAANPGFSDRSIFQILQGRRKIMSNGIKKLFNHFNL